MRLCSLGKGIGSSPFWTEIDLTTVENGGLFPLRPRWRGSPATTAVLAALGGHRWRPRWRFVTAYGCETVERIMIWDWNGKILFVFKHPPAIIRILKMVYSFLGESTERLVSCNSVAIRSGVCRWTFGFQRLFHYPPHFAWLTSPPRNLQSPELLEKIKSFSLQARQMKSSRALLLLASDEMYRFLESSKVVGVANCNLMIESGGRLCIFKATGRKLTKWVSSSAANYFTTCSWVTALEAVE